MNTKNECLTTSVEKAGKLAFGLSRNGSYAAARRGEIPTIDVGRLKRVPMAWLKRLRDGKEEAST